MELPDDWWITQTQREKNRKAFDWFVLQICREGHSADGHFKPRTVNHKVHKQPDFLLNRTKKNGLLCQSTVISFHLVTALQSIKVTSLLLAWIWGQAMWRFTVKCKSLYSPKENRVSDGILKKGNDAQDSAVIIIYVINIICSTNYKWGWKMNETILIIEKDKIRPVC